MCVFSYDQKFKALYHVPDHLQVQKKEQSEEMLSNQMLSGIPEVDLGLEWGALELKPVLCGFMSIIISRAKFRNIEETEQAKQEQHKQRLVSDVICLLSCIHDHLMLFS